jgi:hypothetical protein
MGRIEVIAYTAVYLEHLVDPQPYIKKCSFSFLAHAGPLTSTPTIAASMMRFIMLMLLPFTAKIRIHGQRPICNLMVFY